MFQYQLSNYTRLHAATVIVAVALLYFFSGYLGLLLALPKTNASAVWPASGVALAGVIIFGYRALLGVFLGSLLLNIYALLQIAPPFTPFIIVLIASLATAMGTALQAGLAGTLVEFFCGKNLFGSTPNVLKFLFIVMLSCLISSNVGTLAIALGGIISWKLYAQVLLTWWIGDTVGIFIVTPLIWAWTTSPVKRLPFHKVLEAFALGIAILIVGYLNTVEDAHFSYLFIPLLLWAAVRFRLSGATLALFLAVLIMVLETAYGYGPFVKSSLNESLLVSALFIMVITGTVLALAAELKKRTQKQEIWEGAHRSLPFLVEHWKETIQRWREK